MIVAFGCSGNKKGQQGENIPTVENSAEETDLFADGDKDLFVEEENKDLAAKEEPVKTEEAPAVAEEQAPVIQEEAPVVADSPALTGDMGTYNSEKGDTLMLISFKLYGDYRKWKQIRDANPGININDLAAGTLLKYPKPAVEFTWQPKGLPYLIKRGDYLGSISLDKYGTYKRWKDIWNNNKPMIKDPNLIFAGFTIYYIPDDRNLASE